MITAAIVDDQHLVRTGFRMILEAEPDIEIVGEAGDGISGVSLVVLERPDVVLMDIRMPHQDGIEATRRIVASEAESRVIVLTTFDLDEYVVGAVRAGASGFLLKDVRPEELVRAVRVVAAGEALLSPSVTKQVLSAFVSTPSTAPSPGPGYGDLTERETEVFELMARGRSNGEIADDLVVSETTVKTHVGRVLSKLDLRDRVQAVVYAYEHGIVEPGRPPTGGPENPPRG